MAAAVGAVIVEVTVLVPLLVPAVELGIADGRGVIVDAKLETPLPAPIRY